MGVLDVAKNIGIRHNVSLKVIDQLSGQVIQFHTGHNAATNSLITGIGHYLKGDGVLNQGYYMLSRFVPKYISLGTMGLINQDSDDNGLPKGIGQISYKHKTYGDLTIPELRSLGKVDIYDRLLPGVNVSQTLSDEDDEILRFVDYMLQSPGYGADGYDASLNNNRSDFGLGKIYKERNVITTTGCELISDSFPRVPISFRDIIPETESETAQTIDVVFSAMISTGALAQFREPELDSNGDIKRDSDGNIIRKPYLYITEAGLWSDQLYTVDGAFNGLLAGYRIAPNDEENWIMSVTDGVSRDEALSNRNLLKQNIIRVGINQVVQVVWKIQIGSVEQLTGMYQHYKDKYPGLKWHIV